jgi:hypothetical protein
MKWPIETVKLMGPAGWQVDEWTGYLVPRYFVGIPNEDARAAFTLEFECGYRIHVRPGNLEECIWEILMVHSEWCLS